MDSDLYEPYERLIDIELLGRTISVPENNRLLRCFQFLSLRSISYGDFCWNGDCTNCQFWYREPGEDARAPEKTALSCRFTVREGMSVTRLNPCVRVEGVNNPAAGATQAATSGGSERDSVRDFAAAAANPDAA
jgi:hypothetical protein